MDNFTPTKDYYDEYQEENEKKKRIFFDKLKKLKVKETISRIKNFIRFDLLKFSKKDSMEVRKKKESVLRFYGFVLILTVFIIFLGITQRVLDGKNNEKSKVFLFFTIVRVLINLILFIFFLLFKNVNHFIQLIMFISSVFWNLDIIILNLFTFSGDFVNPNFFLLSFVPIIQIDLTKTFFAYFWMLVYFMMTILYFSFHYINNFEPIELFDEQIRRRRTIMYYVVYSFIILRIIFLLFQAKKKLEKERKLFQNVVFSISTFDLKSKVITNVLNSKTDQRTIKYLQKIIKNMKAFQCWIPKASITQDQDANSDNTESSESSPPNSTLESGKSKLNIHETENCLAKEVTLVLFQLDFNIMKNSMLECNAAQNEKHILGIISKMLSTINLSLKKNGGTIINMFNCRIFVEFGCLKNFVDSLRNALNSIFAVQRQWKSKENEYQDVKIKAFVIAKSLSYYGIFGMKELKMFNLCSKGISNLVNLGKIGKDKGDILIQGKDFYNRLKFDFDLKQVGIIENEDIFEVCKKKKNTKNTEWMYNIDPKTFLMTNDLELENQRIWEILKNQEDFKNYLEVLTRFIKERKTKRDKYSLLLVEACRVKIEEKNNIQE